MAATTLSQGDLAIIGYGTGQSLSAPATEDKLYFVLLKPIGSGTQIFFTDRTWSGSGFVAGGGDGTYTYTAGADLPAGTVISISQAALSAAGVDLEELGDTVYVFQGTDANTPTTFLYAAELATDTAFSGSLANTGLTAGYSAIAIQHDSAAYTGPTTHGESFLWNGSGASLLHSIADASNWVGDDVDGVNAKEQEVQTGPWLLHADVELWGTMSGGGGGLANTLRDPSHASGNDDYNHTRQYDGGSGMQVFWSARDMTFDTVDGKFFVVDSDITGGHNRILQGSIAELLANPGTMPALTVLYSDTGTTTASRLDNFAVDVNNNKIYFTHGDRLERIDYDTASQTPTTLFRANVTAVTSPSGVANPAGSASNFFNDMVADFGTGKIYLSSTRVLASASGDVVSKNFIYELSGLSAASGTDAFQFNAGNTGTARLLPFALNDDAFNPTAGTTASPATAANQAYFFALEYGTLDGLAIDTVNGLLYFSTGEIVFDHDQDADPGDLLYEGGVVASYALNANPTGAINILYEQTAQFGGAIPGLMGDLEVDLVNNHWYVLDYNGLNGINDDNHWFRGSTAGASVPIQFTQTVGDLQGAATVGLTLNHAPTLAGVGQPAVVTEQSTGPGSGETARVALFTGVTIADADTTSADEITGAVVRVSDKFQTGATHQDFLRIDGNLTGVVAGSGIAYTYNQATGAMVLTGPGTVAEYKAALELVTFSTSGDDITAFGAATTRQVSVSVSDGLTMSDEITATVTVTGINDAPVNTPGAAMNYTEDTTGNAAGVPPVNAVTGISVADVDANPATQAITVNLAVNVGTLSLRTDVVGGLAAGQVAGNGTGSLVLTGTQNQINTTLAALNGASLPNGLVYTPPANYNGAATLTIVTNDAGFSGTDPALTGTATSEQDSDTKTLNIANVNDAPTVAGDGTESAPDILEDQPSAAGQTVATLFAGQFADLLDAQQTGPNPTGSVANSLAAIAITANGSGANGQWQYFSGGIWVDIGAASTNAAKLVAAGTAIRFNPTANYNGAAPTLTAVLVDSSGAAIVDGSTVDLSAGGATGGTTRYSSGTVVLSQNVTAVNDAPTVTNLQGNLVSYTEGNPAVRLDAGLDAVVGDVDSADFAGGSLTVAVTGNKVAAEDLLSIATGAVVTIAAGTVSVNGTAVGTFTGGTVGADLVISFNAGATLARVQEVVRAVQYNNTSSTPSTLQRTVTFTLVDGDGVANGGADTLALTTLVDVIQVNAAPVTTASGGTTAFVEGANVASTPVAVDGALTVSDADTATLASATVTITAGFQAGQDVLALVVNAATMGNIAVTGYDAATGVLTLASAGATATLAQWQAALRAVTYTNTSDAPNTAARTVSFLVNDGIDSSVASTKTVSVAAVNDSPVLGGGGGTVAFTEGNNVASTPVVVHAGLTVADADNATLASATVSITAGLQAAEDVLAFTNDGATMGNIAGVYAAGTGVLTLTSAGGTATVAQWQAALRSVTYTNSSENPNTAARTVSFVVNDGAAASAASTQTVTVAAVDDTSVVTPTGGTTAFTEANNVASTPVVVDAGVTLTDADSATLASATVSITGGFQAGQDVLAFTNDGATMGNIAVGGYDGATGVLTLTSAGGTATLAQWQAALRAVTYTNTSDTPNTGNRTIAFVNPGATKTVSVAAVNDTPVATTSGGTTAFTEGNGVPSVPLAVDAALTVSDLDHATLASATVSITVGLQAAEDVLGFVNDGATMGNIAGVYAAGTGVLTLTSAGATATVAQWQAALRAVTYLNTSENPNTAARTVSFVVNDGVSGSAAVTKTVSVAGQNDSPVVTASGGATAFVEGNNVASTPVVVDAAIAVADDDNATLASATVSITGGFQAGQDVLALVVNAGTMGNIAVTGYDAATGVLTLTSAGGTATTAQWQAALRAVTYNNTSQTPNTGARTISFAANDGTTTGAAGTKTVNVTAVNDTPFATASGGTTAFTEGNNVASTPVAVDAAITVTDADNTTLASATVTITGGLQAGEDVLALAGGPYGNITANYVAGTGVLTLTSAGATATVAEWQAALRAVTYTNTSDSPNTGNRTVSFVVNDGASNSAGSTQTVSVAAVNDIPVVSTSGGNNAFVEGNNAPSVPVVVDAGITVEDLDHATLPSATVRITGGFQAGQDVLGLVVNAATMGNIAVTGYDGATGILTLTSAGATATTVQWMAALRAVTYTNTSENPDTAMRTLSYTVNDGVASSAPATQNVSVLAVPDRPVLTATGGTTAFTEGNNAVSTPVVVDGAVAVSDVDSATLASATVSITGGFQAGQDVLALTLNAATMGNIAVTGYDGATGVLTLASAGATATLAQWQAALRAVTYTNTSDSPNTALRTVSFVVNDGFSSSVGSTQNVSVAAVNDTPFATASGGTTAFTEGNNVASTPVAVDAAITVTDADNTTLASATVSITGGLQAGEDVLALAGGPYGNITANYVAGTGVLTLTSAGATATVAEWQAALRAVTYTNTSNTPNTGNRTVSFVVNDGTANSAGSTRTVSVAAVNDTPVVTATGGTTAFTEGNNAASVPVAVDGALTVADLDHATLASATVSITGGFQAGQDVLALVLNAGTMGNIAVTGYDAATGILTLTSAGATATVAQWQAALRAVTYTNTSENPNTALRTVSFVVSDGAAASVAGTQNVSVASVNDTPVVTATGGTTAFTEGNNAASVPVTVDAAVAVADADSTTLASATVSITGGFQAGQDVLALTLNAATMGNIAVTGYDGATGVLTLTSAGATATLAQWQAALRAVTYTNTSETPNTALRTVSYVVNDGAANSLAGTQNVSVAAVNDTPLATTSAGTTAFIEGNNVVSTPVAVDGGLTVTDADNTTLASATVSITGNFRAGQDVLALTVDGATMGNIAVTGYDAATGVLTLTSAGATATLAQWQAALRAVTYTNSSNTPDAAARTVSFVASDGAAASVAATKTVSVAAVNDTPTGGVTITGTAQQNQTLTANHTLADADGLGAIGYQWFANGAVIAGATGTTFTLTQAEVGRTITVRASYTDGGGTLESITSAATAAVGNVNDLPVGGVTIAGTPEQGQTLSAANTLSDPDGMGPIAYQWFENGTAIGGATGSTFTLTSAQVGKTITVSANYVDGGGTLEIVSSAPTAVVAPPPANPNNPPAGSVTIAGTPTQGQTLTASNTITDADGVGPVTYQWRQNGALIAGATAATLVLTQAQVGQAITVTANYTDGRGNAEVVASAATAPVANVNDAPTGAVRLFGATTVGAILSASNNLADLDGLGPISYQWLRDGAGITGATGATYQLAEADVGKTITVRASYVDGFGASEQAVSDGLVATAGTTINAPVAPGVSRVDLDGQRFDGPGTAPTRITLVADSLDGQPDPDPGTATIRQFSQSPGPGGDPGIEDALGTLQFTVELSQPGTTETFSYLFDNGIPQNGFWVLDRDGLWTNLATAARGGESAVSGNQARLDFQITDGGQFDLDGVVNGSITSVGIVAELDLSLIGHAPDTGGNFGLF